MTLNSPDIQTKLNEWQSELRHLTGDDFITIQAFYPLRRFQKIEDISRIVSEETKVDLALIKSRTRKRHVVVARHLLAYFSRLCSDLSLTEIGRFIGRFDHTTVMNACNNIKGYIEVGDSEVAEYAARISKRLEERNTHPV